MRRFRFFCFDCRRWVDSKWFHRCPAKKQTAA